MYFIDILSKISTLEDKLENYRKTIEESEKPEKNIRRIFKKVINKCREKAKTKLLQAILKGK